MAEDCVEVAEVELSSAAIEDRSAGSEFDDVETPEAELVADEAAEVELVNAEPTEDGAYDTGVDDVLIVRAGADDLFTDAPAAVEAAAEERTYCRELDDALLDGVGVEEPLIEAPAAVEAAAEEVVMALKPDSAAKLDREIVEWLLW